MHFVYFYLFYPGDLVTHVGEQEIQSVYGRVGMDAFQTFELL